MKRHEQKKKKDDECVRPYSAAVILQRVSWETTKQKKEAIKQNKRKIVCVFSLLAFPSFFVLLEISVVYDSVGMMLRVTRIGRASVSGTMYI